MQITCPRCRHTFFATTRHAVCNRCGAPFDVWVLLGAAPNDVLELPEQGPLGAEALEKTPVLDESFTALPRELFARETETLENGTLTSAAETADYPLISPHSASSGAWRWAVALASVVVAAVAIYYLLGALRSSPAGNALSEVSAATKADEASGAGGAGGVAAAGTTADGEGAQSRERSDGASTARPASGAPATASDEKPDDKSGTKSGAESKSESGAQAEQEEESAPASRPRIVTPPGSERASNFTLQVASRAQEEEARRIADRLIEAGERARVVRAEIPGRGLWYRVQIGSFETREEAARRGAALKRAGTIDDFLVADLRPRQ